MALSKPAFFAFVFEDILFGISGNGNVISLMPVWKFAIYASMHTSHRPPKAITQ